jgi:hypothetical protein
MRKDPSKVASYSRLLANKLKKDGDTRASDRILGVIDKMGGSSAVMDTLTALPVDQESRLDIAEIDYSPKAENIILSQPVQNMLDDFMDTIKSKEKMLSLGLNFRTTLLLWASRMWKNKCGKVSGFRVRTSINNSSLRHIDLLAFRKYSKKYSPDI